MVQTTSDNRTVPTANAPVAQCGGRCTACSIQRSLNDRDTFSRADVARLLGLAFRTQWRDAYERGFAAGEAEMRALLRLDTGPDAKVFSAGLVQRLGDHLRARADADRGILPPQRFREPLADLSGCEWPEVTAPGSVGPL